MKRAFSLVAAACLAPLAHAGEFAPLTPKGSIAMPGVEGRFDHASIDVRNHRLFFAALGNNTLEVVDVAAGSRLHTIPDLKKPTGVLFLDDPEVLVVANGDDGTCRFYDPSTYKEKGRINGLDDADNLRFDAKAKRVYLGYGDGALAVIDPVKMTLTASIPLPKHPESFQLEETGSRIFVNIPDAKQIAVVDRVVNKIVVTWPLEDALANFPMALAEKDGHLFVGCRLPSKVLAFDTQTGKCIAECTADGDMDDLFYDPKESRLLASCGAGFVDVFQITSTGSMTPTQRLATAAGARTGFLNTKLGIFCLAVPHRGSQSAEIDLYSFSTP